MTFKDFLSFILQYFGVANTGDTPENKGQCVGLIEVWLDLLGLNNPHLFGNAKDLLTNADSSKFDIIYNKVGDTSQFPLCGDILVLDWGKDGHTCIVVIADGNNIIVFEQNNPEGQSPRISKLDYTGVIGWLHPKNFSIDQQAIIDELRKARDDNYNLYQGEVAKNTELTTENQGLKTQLAQVNQADAALLDQYKKKLEEDDTAIQSGLKAEADLKQAQITIQNIATALHTTPDEKSILDAVKTLQQPLDEATMQLVKVIEQMWPNLQKGKKITFLEYVQLGINLFIRR